MSQLIKVTELFGIRFGKISYYKRLLLYLSFMSFCIIFKNIYIYIICDIKHSDSEGFHIVLKK